MPQTKKGKKILKAMRQKYGKKKGEQIYYASIVKGKIKGAEKEKKGGKLAKAKRTYAEKNKSRKKNKRKVLERAARNFFK